MDLIQIPSRCFELLSFFAATAVPLTKVASFSVFSAKLLGISSRNLFPSSCVEEERERATGKEEKVFRIKTPAREIYETRDKKLNRAIFFCWNFRIKFMLLFLISKSRKNLNNFTEAAGKLISRKGGSFFKLLCLGAFLLLFCKLISFRQNHIHEFPPIDIRKLFRVICVKRHFE